MFFRPYSLKTEARPERSWVKNLSASTEVAPHRVDLNDVIPERSTYLCRVPTAFEITAGTLSILKRKGIEF